MAWWTIQQGGSVEEGIWASSVICQQSLRLRDMKIHCFHQYVAAHVCISVMFDRAILESRRVHIHTHIHRCMYMPPIAVLRRFWENVIVFLIGWTPWDPILDTRSATTLHCPWNATWHQAGCHVVQAWYSVSNWIRNSKVSFDIGETRG